MEVYNLLTIDDKGYCYCLHGRHLQGKRGGGGGGGHTLVVKIFGATNCERRMRVATLEGGGGESGGMPTLKCFEK